MQGMELPGPDHPIAITPAAGRMRALWQGRVVAESDHVLMLTEAAYGPVAYFPRADALMAMFSKTERQTFCPYKGQARYFSLSADGDVAQNAVWTYEDPFPAMAAIRGYLAFYANVVEVDDL